MFICINRIQNDIEVYRRYTKITPVLISKNLVVNLNKDNRKFKIKMWSKLTWSTSLNSFASEWNAMISVSRFLMLSCFSMLYRFLTLSRSSLVSSFSFDTIRSSFNCLRFSSISDTKPTANKQNPTIKINVMTAIAPLTYTSTASMKELIK